MDIMAIPPIEFDATDRAPIVSDKKSMAEKLKTKYRIKQIEKTVRSISSILDDRMLHDLAPVKFTGAHTFVATATDADPAEEANKLMQKRKNVLESTMKTSSAAVLKQLQAQGMDGVSIANELADEEKIWHEKKNSKTYNQKRKVGMD